MSGGELNMHLEAKLDSSTDKSQNTTLFRKKINTLIVEVELLAIWRDLHPNQMDYTHYS